MKLDFPTKKKKEREKCHRFWTKDPTHSQPLFRTMSDIPLLCLNLPKIHFFLSPRPHFWSSMADYIFSSNSDSNSKWRENTPTQVASSVANNGTVIVCTLHCEPELLAFWLTLAGKSTKRWAGYFGPYGKLVRAIFR